MSKPVRPTSGTVGGIPTITRRELKESQKRLSELADSVPLAILKPFVVESFAGRDPIQDQMYTEKMAEGFALMIERAAELPEDNEEHKALMSLIGDLPPAEAAAEVRQALLEPMSPTDEDEHITREAGYLGYALVRFWLNMLMDARREAGGSVHLSGTLLPVSWRSHTLEYEEKGQFADFAIKPERVCDALEQVASALAVTLPSNAPPQIFGMTLTANGNSGFVLS